jgi:hypothetical protein
MRIQSEGMKETDKLETRRKLQLNTQSPDNAKVIGETNCLRLNVTECLNKKGSLTHNRCYRVISPERRADDGSTVKKRTWPLFFVLSHDFRTLRLIDFAI